MKKLSQRKQRRKKEKIKSVIAQALFIFFVIITPIVGLILYGLGVPIPRLVIGIYSSVAMVIGGIILIVFSVYEKYGFAQEGYNRMGLWVSKKDAKFFAFLFGSIMIAFGIFISVLMLFYSA